MLGVGFQGQLALGSGAHVGEAFRRRQPSGKVRVAQGPCLLFHKQDLVVVGGVEMLEPSRSSASRVAASSGSAITAAIAFAHRPAALPAR